MTALSEYQRLEASGLWRMDENAQRREVIVSVGDATLVITDLKEVALSHWSLPAVERITGSTERPAIYRPANDSSERLEIDDEVMIGAIERVRAAIEKRRPHPGRLRGWIIAGTCAALGALAVFWLPGALVRQTVRIVPDVTRVDIGEQLLDRMLRLSGAPCDTALGRQALSALRARLMPAGGQIAVVSSGVTAAQHLPGRIVVLNRALVEDFEDPAVVAGYVLAERQRAVETDPLHALLRDAGLVASVKLLTTGHLPEDVLDSYAETLLTSAPVGIDKDALLALFDARDVRSSPYAYAIDITGETTLTLIEADPETPQSAREILSDANWIALQSICGG